MSIETAADRLLLLNDFGVSATHSGNTFNVIFDNDYLDADIGGSVSFAVSQPRATCRTADISTAAEGDAITVDGASYIIRVIMNDGTGMGSLILEAQ